MLRRLRLPMPMPATAIRSEGGVAPPSPSVEADTTKGAAAALANVRRVVCRARVMAGTSVPLIDGARRPLGADGSALLDDSWSQSELWRRTLSGHAGSDERIAERLDELDATDGFSSQAVIVGNE